jgi:hypothetical protein
MSSLLQSSVFNHNNLYEDENSNEKELFIKEKVIPYLKDVFNDLS